MVEYFAYRFFYLRMAIYIDFSYDLFYFRGIKLLVVDCLGAVC